MNSSYLPSIILLVWLNKEHSFCCVKLFCNWKLKSVWSVFVVANGVALHLEFDMMYQQSCTLPNSTFFFVFFALFAF